LVKREFKKRYFENELRSDINGEVNKNARKKRNLTQEQLGELAGVKNLRFQYYKIT
jgi:HTH-type transcriptional regulator / antitoxin HipB